MVAQGRMWCFLQSLWQDNVKLWPARALIVSTTKLTASVLNTHS